MKDYQKRNFLPTKKEGNFCDFMEENFIFRLKFSVNVLKRNENQYIRINLVYVVYV